MSNSNFYKLFKSYKIFLKKNEQNNLKLFKKKNASNNKKKKNLGHYILDQKSPAESDLINSMIFSHSLSSLSLSLSATKCTLDMSENTSPFVLLCKLCNLSAKNLKS